MGGVGAVGGAGAVGVAGVAGVASAQEGGRAGLGWPSRGGNQVTCLLRRGDETSESDAARALDVVVEAAVLLPVLVEDGRRLCRVG